MIAFFDKDLSVLVDMRSKIMKEVDYIWCFVYFDNRTNVGEKLVIANEFDNKLSDKKLNEVLDVMECYCSENLLEFQYSVL